MAFARYARLAAVIAGASLGGAALSACTYVERDRTPPQQSTVLVPQQQPSPTIVTPAQPTVTVRPSY